MFSFLLVMRYMVASGVGGDKTEIVDVSNPLKSCVLDDEITYRYGSTGGILGTTPVICGGYDGSQYFKECLLYGTSQKITMNSKRRYSSSVGLNNSMFWITGGRDKVNTFDSTEFVTREGAVNGPPLPEPVYYHCSVLFPGNGNVYVIGGYPTTNKVWVANPSNEFTFAQGPPLITSRNRHMCSTMSLGAKSIIVAAGGRKGNFGLVSVEILDPLSNQWVAGK